MASTTLAGMTLFSDFVVRYQSPPEPSESSPPSARPRVSTTTAGLDETNASTCDMGITRSPKIGDLRINLPSFTRSHSPVTRSPFLSLTTSHRTAAALQSTKSSKLIAILMHSPQGNVKPHAPLTVPILSIKVGSSQVFGERSFEGTAGRKKLAGQAAAPERVRGNLLVAS